MILGVCGSMVVILLILLVQVNRLSIANSMYSDNIIYYPKNILWCSTSEGDFAGRTFWRNGKNGQQKEEKTPYCMLWSIALNVSFWNLENTINHHNESFPFRYATSQFYHKHPRSSIKAQIHNDLFKIYSRIAYNV